MKSKLILAFTAFFCCILLLASCGETKKPGVNKATWDLYPELSFTELISNVLESEQEFLKTTDNEVNTSFSLSEGWTQTERYTFDGSVSEKDNKPYTLTMNIFSKSTEGEKEITNDITSYVFLEHNPDANTLSVCGSFTHSVKTNGTYETIALSTLPKQLAENELIVMLENSSVENLPEKNIIPEGVEAQTVTRRYNHKQADATTMALVEFPDTTLMEILSRFDDAYGDILKNVEHLENPDTESQQEYTSVSFDVTCEYDWKKSETLDEFTDGSDIHQPYTYSAVYTADDSDGNTLVATLDIFAEIEPRHSILKLRESVFTIEYAGETLFHDTHNKEETLILLGTIMQYHPEDTVVTPSPEEIEVQVDAEVQENV